MLIGRGEDFLGAPILGFSHFLAHIVSVEECEVNHQIFQENRFSEREFVSIGIRRKD